MDICQQALVTHLRNQFPTSAIKTLDRYAGELSKQEVPKLTQLLPACLVLYIDGSPISQDANLQFDLLICTESRAFDRKKNQLANLGLASRILRFLKTPEGFIFHPGPGRTGTYEVSRERTRARIIIQNARFTVIAISVFILDRTDVSA